MLLSIMTFVLDGNLPVHFVNKMSHEQEQLW